MLDPPDYDDLARRYLDLWQEQWAAMAADPRTAELLTQLYSLVGQQMSAFAPFLQGFSAFGPGPGPAADSSGAADEIKKHREDHDAARSAPERSVRRGEPPSRATPSGAAPDDRADGVDELTRRLAVVEERLARIETVAAAPRPRRRARKTRS
jgi:hypothetical protein